MSENKPITAKQEAFCRHYVANGFNGTQAAIKAGYAESGADVEAARLLGNARVAEYIETLKAPLVKKTTITAEKLAQMVSDCLEFDLTEWFDVGPHGQLLLRCALSELPEQVRKVMIQGFKQTKFGVEVNLVSKQFLLDMQARFLSMYKDQVKVTNTYETKTDDDIENELKELEGK
jgi:phage terminase small subunit